MPTVLTSWKEIAAHLGKGVRTVQRWEHEFGLPVRRPSPNGGVVVAIPNELNEWLRSRPKARARDMDEVSRLHERVAFLEAENERLRQELNSELKKPELSSSVLVALNVCETSARLIADSGELLESSRALHTKAKRNARRSKLP